MRSSRRASRARRRSSASRERKARTSSSRWLAVLKAGAAYLPIDPELPAGAPRVHARRRARRACVLTDERRSRGSPPGGVAVAVASTRDAARIARAAPTTPPDADARPRRRRLRDLHVGVDRHAEGRRRSRIARSLRPGARHRLRARSAPDDVVAQLANPAFDASTFEFWGALANGARIVPIAKATALAPRALAAALAAERRHDAVPHDRAVQRRRARGARGVRAAAATCCSAARRSSRAGCARCCAPARRGASCTSTARPRRRRSRPGTRCATSRRTRRRDADRPADREHRGRTCCDPDGEPLRAGRARRDLHRRRRASRSATSATPTLTAERFVATRDRADPPARLLPHRRSRARSRDDGAHRVPRPRATGRSRCAATASSSTRSRRRSRACPTCARRSSRCAATTSETRQLVAYLVPADPLAPPPATLRRELRRAPARVHAARRDRVAAVAAAQRERQGRPARAARARRDAPRGGVATPPRDMFEGVLARIWEDLLGVRGVGVYDHFFEIGGHSLLAARLVDAIERETGFDGAAHRAVRRRHDRRARARAPRGRARRGRADRRRPRARHAAAVRVPARRLPGRRLLQPRARARAGSRPADADRASARARRATRSRATIEAMAADRLRALRAIRPRGPYVIGGHCNGALVAFEMARQLVAAGEAVPAVVLIESRAPAAGAGGRRTTRGVYVKFDARRRADAADAARPAVRGRAVATRGRSTRTRAAAYGGHVVVVQAAASGARRRSMRAGDGSPRAGKGMS